MQGIQLDGRASGGPWGPDKYRMGRRLSHKMTWPEEDQKIGVQKCPAEKFVLSRSFENTTKNNGSRFKKISLKKDQCYIGTPKPRWIDNIKMDLIQMNIGYKFIDGSCAR